MMKKKITNQTGFTIVELMIASMVFSVILLMVTAGIIQISNAFYKGSLRSRTQQTARTIIDDISRGIQHSGEDIVTTSGAVPYPGTIGSNYGFCVNGVGYSYVMDQNLVRSSPDANQNTAVLIAYPVACGAFTVINTNAARSQPGSKELVGLGMKITQLRVENVNGKYIITVEVASGARDLFSPDPNAISTSCRGTAGSTFCVMSRLTTTVQKRIK